MDTQVDDTLEREQLPYCCEDSYHAGTFRLLVATYQVRTYLAKCTYDEIRYPVLIRPEKTVSGTDSSIRSSTCNATGLEREREMSVYMQDHHTKYTK
jgi:carbamoylphosphate synthase large subunit